MKVKKENEMIQRSIWPQFVRHKPALVSALILVEFALLALFAPLISRWLGHGYTEIDLAVKLQSPSVNHIFGTDGLGRDVFVLILYGARVSLTVALIAALVATAVGLVVGLISGYLGGPFDELMMRLVDTMLSLPVLAIMILLSAIDLVSICGLTALSRFLNPDILKIIIIVVIFGWMGVARVIRGCVLSLRESDYIIAARAIGQNRTIIIIRHLLPNVMAPAIVAATLQTGTVIIYEAVLSYLGLGIQPPLPSWGNILQRAQEYIILGTAPWLVIIPGVCILLTVTAVNFLGDGLRDMLDVKTVR